MTRWELRNTKEAEGDLSFFIKAHPDIWNEMKKALILLAQEVDPRQPQNINLSVKEIEHDAPGFYRLRVGTVRIIFTLEATRSGKQMGIQKRDRVEEFHPPKFIIVIEALERSKAYGKILRERYKKWRKR